MTTSIKAKLCNDRTNIKTCGVSELTNQNINVCKSNKIHNCELVKLMKSYPSSTVDLKDPALWGNTCYCSYHQWHTYMWSSEAYSSDIHLHVLFIWRIQLYGVAHIIHITSCTYLWSSRAHTSDVNLHVLFIWRIQLYRVSHVIIHISLPIRNIPVI